MTEPLSAQSAVRTFSASADVWRLITDHWYGERVDFDPEAHKAAEKLMADIDEATHPYTVALDQSHARTEN